MKQTKQFAIWYHGMDRPMKRRYGTADEAQAALQLGLERMANRGNFGSGEVVKLAYAHAPTVSGQAGALRGGLDR